MVGLIDRGPQICKACGQTKPAADFELFSRYCKPCFKKRQADRSVRSKSPFQSVEEWEAFCASFGNRCLRCGGAEKLTMDHIDPYGGRFDIDNIQPLCSTCNSIKGKKFWDFRPAPEGIQYVRVCPMCGGKTHRPPGYESDVLSCRTRRCLWRGLATHCPVVRRPPE